MRKYTAALGWCPFTPFHVVSSKIPNAFPSNPAPQPSRAEPILYAATRERLVIRNQNTPSPFP